jgi:DNA-binding MarR family transcriptional regulator
MRSNLSSDSCVPLGCVCATLRRTSRAVTQLYEAALRPTGLRATQFTLLQVLESAGEIRQADLADLLATDSTTLTRTLKLLETEGWIQSSPGEDKRERLFRLAPPGREQLKRAKARWSEVQDQLQATLGRADWTALLGALNRATDAAVQISL